MADSTGRIGGDRQLQPSGKYGQQPEDGFLMQNSGMGISQGEQYDWIGDARGRWQEPSNSSDVQRLGHHHHKGSPLGSWSPDERGAIRVEGPAAGASGSLLGCDWLFCHDARIRPVESGTFPLAPTSPGRLGALRLFGNGLDFETAVNFISAYMEAAEIADVMGAFT